MGQVYETIDIQVGRVLRTTRKEQRLSVSNLALRADVSSDTIIAIEAGAERANAQQLFQFSRALGIELQSFFGDCCEMEHQAPPAMIHRLRQTGMLSDMIAQIRANARGERAA